MTKLIVSHTCFLTQQSTAFVKGGRSHSEGFWGQMSAGTRGSFCRKVEGKCRTYAYENDKYVINSSYCSHIRLVFNNKKSLLK